MMATGICAYSAFTHRWGEFVPKGYRGREKTERLHMLISPEELEAIDQWQHSNRVGTRSDAVRRLVRIGLIFNIHADEFRRVTRDLINLMHEQMLGKQSISELRVPIGWAMQLITVGQLMHAERKLRQTGNLETALEEAEKELVKARELIFESRKSGSKPVRARDVTSEFV
ncbi:MAG: hypothetical protein E5W30_05670, partial [Mesorhizobium sp.]